MSFFKNPRFTAASLAITLTFLAMFGSMFLMTQYWQFVLGYTPLEAGVRFIPFAMTMMITAPLSARFVERIGTKAVVTSGLTVVTLALLLLSFIKPHTSYPVVLGFMLTDGRRHGPDDGAGHRERHGLAAAGEGRRRLGGQRHDTADGRRPRRGDHRHDGGQRVLVGRRLDRRIVRAHPGADRRSPRDRSAGRCAKVAPQLGDQAGNFVEAVNTEFVNGLSSGLRLGAAIVLIAAIVAFKFLPAFAVDPLAHPEQAQRPDGELGDIVPAVGS